MFAGMHVMLFLLRQFQLCANAVMPGKLRVGLKISDLLRAVSHFNSQNTHSHFCNSQFAFYPRPGESLWLLMPSVTRHWWLRWLRRKQI